MRTWRLSLMMTIFFAAVLFGVTPVNAHGSGRTAELYLVPVGPYFLSIWSSPGILRTGEVHFSSAIKDTDSEVVLDCTVTITLTSLDDQDEGFKLITRAPTQLTNFEHEIEQVVEEPGRYSVIVDVVDPAGNGGQADFEIEIVPLPVWLKGIVFFAITFTSITALMLIKQGVVLFGLWKPKQINRSVARPVRRS